jgi:hypothetical protein
LTQPAGLSPLKWLSHPCQAQSTPSSATIFAASPGITSTAFITFIALLLTGNLSPNPQPIPLALDVFWRDCLDQHPKGVKTT